MVSEGDILTSGLGYLQLIDIRSYTAIVKMFLS